MRAWWMAAAAALMLCAPDGAAYSMSWQQSAAGGQALGAVPPALVGSWKSEPDRMRLVTELERSVWGADASSVRTVELRLDGSGQGRLTITRSIVDAQGVTNPASVSVEAVELRVGAARPPAAGRVEHAVEVVAAERRYPDDPEYRWPLDGVRVRVIAFEGDAGRIEIRFDTREGRGSFWETLRRDGDAAGRTSSTGAGRPR